MKGTNRIASAGAILIGLSAPAAQAGYIVDLTQQGSNVVANGSGAIDLTGLKLDFRSGNSAFILPSLVQINTGPAFPDFSRFDAYAGITGPTGFGNGDQSFASSGSGDLVGIRYGVPAPGIPIVHLLFVPTGYVSGNPLSDTSTYNNQTFSSLGVTPGPYKWTWGTGPNQNFTLVVGTIPEPSTWAMMLLGFAGLGFIGHRSARQSRRAACNI